MHMTPQNPFSRVRLLRLSLWSFLLATLLTISGCFAKPDLTRQTETLTTLGFKQVDMGWTLILPDHILFKFDQDKLKPELHHSIADVAQQLLAVKILQLRVEGHTDNVGTREYNRDLSLRRANTVADVLVAEGFSATDVEIRGSGMDQPIADNATDQGRAENRRVEIIVLSNALLPH